jgi:hypothetical protein
MKLAFGIIVSAQTMSDELTAHASHRFDDSMLANNTRLLVTHLLQCQQLMSTDDDLLNESLRRAFLHWCEDSNRPSSHLCCFVLVALRIRTELWHRSGRNIDVIAQLKRTLTLSVDIAAERAIVHRYDRPHQSLSANEPVPSLAELAYDAGFVSRLAAAIAPVPVNADHDAFWRQQILYYQRMMDCVAFDPLLRAAAAPITGPPQPVDVVWHAHQLDAAYERDCRFKLGRSLSHKPNVPDPDEWPVAPDLTLARSFLARFGVDLANSARGFDRDDDDHRTLFANTVLQPHILAEICAMLALDAARQATDHGDAPGALVATLAATQLELLSCVNRRFREAVSQAPLWFECVFSLMPDFVGTDCNNALRDCSSLEVVDDTNPLGPPRTIRNRAGHRVFRAHLVAAFVDAIRNDAESFREDVQDWHKRVLFLLKGNADAEPSRVLVSHRNPDWRDRIRFDFLHGIVPDQLEMRRFRWQDYDCVMVDEF